MAGSTLFDGMYKELWRRIVPEGLTRAELEFLNEILDLELGQSVLDVMCGYGRHSLGLAGLGYAVTAVDNSADYIREIAEQSKGLPVTALVVPVEEFVPVQRYQAAICMGNSISSLDRAATLTLFQKIHEALEPGARFVLNTWMITEIVVKKFRATEWYQIQEFKYLLANKYLLHPTRMETVHTVIAPDGSMEERQDTDYIFSFAEMESLLEQAGFRLLKIFSTPRKRPYQLGDEHAYFIAERG